MHLYTLYINFIKQDVLYKSSGRVRLSALCHYNNTGNREMISSKDDIQKRMLGSKTISPKNTKLGSMANIANRSPTNRFENKMGITNNTLTSRKNVVESQQRYTDNTVMNSPKKSTNYAQNESTKPATHEPSQPGFGRLNAEKNSEEFRNNIPSKAEVISTIKHNKQYISGNTTAAVTVNLPNGDVYNGSVEQGKYSGQGEYYFKAQDLAYRGAFMEGKQHGQGVLINVATGQAIYEGAWERGTKNGQGNYFYSPNQYYNGNWKDDQKHGNGFFSFQGGSYSGQWAHNRANGRGNLKLADNTEFKGRFENNQFIEGTVKYPNGDQYYGQMKNNRRNSEDSSYINFATKMRYKGAYLNDRKHGKGSIIYENGDELTGIFTEGLINQDEVVSYRWRDGTVFQGWFKQGKPHKGTITLPTNQKYEI